MTDEQAIQELLARWAECDAEQDGEGQSQLYAVDGRHISMRGEYVGRAAIRRGVEERAARNPPDRRTMHIFGPSRIIVDSDTAEAVCAYVAYGRVGELPWEVMTVGRFHNQLIRTDGGWLFAKVHNRAIGSAAGPADALRGEFRRA